MWKMIVISEMVGELLLRLEGIKKAVMISGVHQQSISSTDREERPDRKPSRQWDILAAKISQSKEQGNA